MAVTRVKPGEGVFAWVVQSLGRVNAMRSTIALTAASLMMLGAALVSCGQDQPAVCDSY